ncbi:MAG: hypothetical protein A3J85_07845 [Desulfobacula sp. RIFOXYA12_FULL_46_16]|nr:MAG: hypothetical protein A3J85_07845 [Desulfobacula sp. RIFOXYA12_FULL_46_16]
MILMNNASAQNTLAVRRLISGIIYPGTTEQGQASRLVNIANQHHLAFYPVPCGKNIGYGEKLPVYNEP